ncbi:MAG: DUF2189 domain-containing protein [Pseudomonadota bacterium]
MSTSHSPDRARPPAPGPRAFDPAAGPSPAFGFPEGPKLNPVHFDDIKAALREGLEDFLAAPLYGLVFSGIYVVGGLFMLACLALWDTIWAILPLVIAFPLAGPFLAVGLYEVSRRRSAGLPLRGSAIFGVIWRQRDRELAWMSFVTLFIFWLWAYQVRILLALFLGFNATFASWAGFAEAVLTTQNGLLFLAVGTVIGAVISLGLFSITVISLPLLVDRDLDIITAIASSVAVVRRNPGPMLTFGCTVAGLTLLALAPAFLGLFLVFPVLGHATWRLYSRAVAPGAGGGQPAVSSA